MTDSRQEQHLTELIAKFYNISKRDYNGKTYDNVLNIFDELSLDEQKALLRGALGVYAAATSALIHDRDLIDYGDADALLGYLTRLKAAADPTNTAVNKPPTVVSPARVDKPIIDRPATLGLIFIASIFLLLISFAATHESDESMKNILIVKNVLEIIMSGSK